MARRVLNTGNPYRYFPPGVFDTGLAASLPKAYQKFYNEWNEEPTPVHWIPQAGKWKRNEKTGSVNPIQNVPIPLKYPKEFNQCLLGGEAVVKGYRKKPSKRRFPHFWIPTLKRTAVYSKILDKYFEVLATDRVLQLVHHYQGFDEYIMQTKANDLKTSLALGIKREMIKALHAGCPAYKEDPNKQNEVLAKYKKYGDEYTPEEAEWYGYNLYEATKKISDIITAEEQAKIVPLKHQLRLNLIAELKEIGLDKVERVVRTEQGKIVDVVDKEVKPWYSKLNPFGKK